MTNVFAAMICILGMHLALPALAAEDGEVTAITLGNGAQNLVETATVAQEGSTFTFPRVLIVGNGWLVMHPYADGKPVRNVYVGSAYVTDGENRNVAVEVDTPPGPGERYIVMLHRDVNENQVFDFNDGIDVVDAPVFEGSKMIALRFQARE